MVNNPYNPRNECPLSSWLSNPDVKCSICYLLLFRYTMRRDEVETRKKERKREEKRREGEKYITSSQLFIYSFILYTLYQREVAGE